MFAYVYFIPSVGYVWSFLHGIVAAVLWAAEGVYLSANMNEHDKGVKSGIFWGVYMSGTILGNLAVFFILRFIGLMTLLTLKDGMELLLLCLYSWVASP